MSVRSIEYRDVSEEFSDSILDLYHVVFPVRFTSSVVKSLFIDPSRIIAVMAIATVQVADDIPVFEEKLVGIITTRIQDPRSLLDMIHGREEACLYFFD